MCGNKYGIEINPWIEYLTRIFTSFQVPNPLYRLKIGTLFHNIFTGLKIICAIYVIVT
jgi:hypothetical protein